MNLIVSIFSEAFWQFPSEQKYPCFPTCYNDTKTSLKNRKKKTNAHTYVEDGSFAFQNEASTLLQSCNGLNHRGFSIQFVFVPLCASVYQSRRAYFVFS